MISLFRLTLAGLVLLLLAPLPVWAQTPPPVVVRVAPASVSVAAGQTVEVAVEVVEVQDLYGADIALVFDPAVVEVVDADPTLDGIQVSLGPFLDPGFVLVNLADNQIGALRMATTQMNPSTPKNGTGVLIVVTLRGKEAGASTSLTVTRSQLARRDGMKILAMPVSGQLEVVSEAPPGPTATPMPTQAAGTPLPTRTPLPTAIPATITPTATSLPPTEPPLPTQTPSPSSTPATLLPSPHLPAKATATTPPEIATSEPAAATALPPTMVPSSTTVASAPSPGATQATGTTVAQAQPETPSSGSGGPSSRSLRDGVFMLVLAGIAVVSLALVTGLGVLAFVLTRRRS